MHRTHRQPHIYFYIFVPLLHSQVFTYDNSQVSQVTEILEKLLKDMSTMVLGSALAAFQEICPTQYALLHCHYRKLCTLMVDMDEWSQVSCRITFNHTPYTIHNPISPSHLPILQVCV
ncbi:hypothetical protein EON65_46490, partial [archaeon]